MQPVVIIGTSLSNYLWEIERKLFENY